MKEIPKTYKPQEVEDKIYQTWEKSGYFNPDNLPGERSEYFSIAMPPPNCTGTLHTGHAIMLAYQDLIMRYNRLLGKKTLWLPGTDHAAIATQAKVEKILYKEEKKTRHDLGKGKFLQKVVDYAEESKNTINNQVRKMGSSCDWSRERYTLDEGLSQVVKHAFLKMYEAGVIYRGDRIVNWCPHCMSTLSDDEVEYQAAKGKFYTFKYAKDFPLLISTTRPETKLGDTAVAVNPKDKRYQKYIGQEFTIDIGAGQQKIKIIGDDSVDMNLGTGALGVTPAHSMIDYEMAQKNDLSIIKVINEDGTMTDKAGPDYQGLPVLQARDKLVKWLKDNDLMVKQEDIEMNLTVCYRCGNTVEPLPSKQWFIDVNKKITLKDNKYFQNKSIKEAALGVIKDREIKIIPQKFEQDYFRWLDNLRDWCISRQIWFGHQIPVWYKKADKGINITFIRHGESQGNANDQASGHQGDELTDKGIKESQNLKSQLADENFDKVFSSDLSRSVQTAEIIFPDKEIIQDQRLREIDFGDLTGKTNEERNKYRVSGFPNGESYQQVRERILSFLSDLIDKYDGQRIALIGHSGTWKALEIILNNKSFDLEHLKIHATREPVEYQLKEIISVGLSDPQGSGWQQDEDTLDTWFSSGLWTFSTLMDKDYQKYDSWEDWVKGSADLEFHPTSVMETGYDILFFWIARMIIQTTFMMGEIPFEHVYLHGLVRDEKGRKMSKSLGNVVDPLDLIDKYGTDALRIAMITGTSAGADTRLYDEKVEGFRNFVNKLWNISRYILTSVKDIRRIPEKPTPQTLADEWILSKLDLVTEQVSKDLDKFNFSPASDALRDFTWNNLADWYIENAKFQMSNDKLKTSTEEILLYVLERLLILWHPFIPFVTEEIWANFKAQELLMVQQWPQVKYIGQAEKQVIESQVLYPFWKFEEIIMNIRNLRAEFKIDPGQKVDVTIIPAKKDNLADIRFEELQNNIINLAKLDHLMIGQTKPAGSVSHVLEGVGQICLHLESLLDLEQEKQRLQNEIESVKKFIATLEKKLKNNDFKLKAPKDIVAKEEFKLNDQKEKLAKLEDQLKGFE
ncbi:MAG: class I tRNA ligase family protein [Candidatus Buchananbacteria bacterium]|nr:class I tRNA ligase family protein [Candidatus Buchananbacteria bacterium]